MTTETNNARGEWVLVPREPSAGMWDSAENAMIESEWAYNAGEPDARSDAHGFPTMRIWQAVVAYRAMLAAAPPPPAEAQAVAKLVNRKDSDGGKTTTFIRPTSLGMDLPLGEYPLHLHPPPSAPVGVEGLVADLETIWHSVSDDKETNAAYQRLKSALAQQPAAVDEATRLLRAYRGAPKFSNDHNAIKQTCALEDEIDLFLATQHQEPPHDHRG